MCRHLAFEVDQDQPGSRNRCRLLMPLDGKGEQLVVEGWIVEQLMVETLAGDELMVEALIGTRLMARTLTSNRLIGSEQEDVK